MLIDRGDRHSNGHRRIFTVEEFLDTESLEALLGRRARVGCSHIEGIREAKVVVTGSGGTIGKALARALITSGVGRILAVDRCESGLVAIEREAERRGWGRFLSIELCDVQDGRAIFSMFRREQPEIVFHAAAHKHVHLMERFPCEATRNNVLGTQNVLEAAADGNVRKLVLVSTDKAVAPVGVMGRAKRASELLVGEYRSQGQAGFVVTRLGNILGSSGSILEVFCDQLTDQCALTITSPDAERYFLCIEEGIRVLLHAAVAEAGDVFVPPVISSVSIGNLAGRIQKILQERGEPSPKVSLIGLRAGEKLSESFLYPFEEQCAVEREEFRYATGLPDSRGTSDLLLELIRTSERNQEARTRSLLAEIAHCGSCARVSE